MEGDGCYKRPITDVQKRFAKQIVFAQRNFRCATVVSIRASLVGKFQDRFS